MHFITEVRNSHLHDDIGSFDGRVDGGRGEQPLQPPTGASASTSAGVNVIKLLPPSPKTYPSASRLFSSSDSEEKMVVFGPVRLVQPSQAFVSKARSSP
jgi:hypothetical protein